MLANLLVLGRDLRSAGLPIGSGQVLSLVEAVAAVDPRRKDDFYAAAKTTLVTGPDQIPVFDAIFDQYWQRVTNTVAPVEFSVPDPRTSSEAPEMERGQSQDESQGEEGQVEQAAEKSVVAIEDSAETSENAPDQEEMEAPPEDVMVFSAREVLRKKDFSQFSSDEVNEARRMIESMSWKLGTRKTRRLEKATNGEYIDYRRTLRASMKHRGVPLELRRRRRKDRMRPLILICDISGSMDRYSRLLLRFVHALEHGLDTVEVFVFSTRLTRITRELRKRDVDSAIEQVVKSVDDWSGGTRIGEAIKTFNFKWARRVLRSGATVIMISDGWDRGDPLLLSKEMSRLQRSCRRLIWLNPLLGAPGYQPLTQGIRAALPFVDAFLPIHNMESLEALARLLGDMDDQPPVRRQIAATGPGKTLPNRPFINERGELLINVPPMFDGKKVPAARKR
ncbi:MAG: vWA domain-containing protein [Thermomicrobiales bacterium]